MSTNAAQDHLGPIDYLVVEFPGGRVAGAGFRELVKLVDQRQINVLDLEFVARRVDGTVERIEAHEAGDAGGLDLELFDGAASGLLMADDVEQVGSSIAPGSVAAVLVYEILVVLPAIAAWESDGASVTAEGPILAGELEEALDATDS